MRFRNSQEYTEKNHELASLGNEKKGKTKQNCHKMKWQSLIVRIAENLENILKNTQKRLRSTHGLKLKWRKYNRYQRD